MIVLNPELKSMNHNPKVLSSEAKSLVLKSLTGRRTCDQSHVVSQYLIEESRRFPTAPHRTTTRTTTRPHAPFRRNTDIFLSLSVKKPSVFSVGRFQVAPSKESPNIRHQEPRPLSQATPTAHSPPPYKRDQSESSEISTEELSESESSTVTISPPGQLPGFHDNPGGQERKRMEEEEERKRMAGRRPSVGLWEGSAGSIFSQSWNRSAPLISSDESDRENEEMWVELQQLRER